MHYQNIHDLQISRKASVLYLYGVLFLARPRAYYLRIKLTNITIIQMLTCTVYYVYLNKSTNQQINKSTNLLVVFVCCKYKKFSLIVLQFLQLEIG